jgi:hypothetical protein
MLLEDLVDDEEANDVIAFETISLSDLITIELYLLDTRIIEKEEEEVTIFDSIYKYKKTLLCIITKPVYKYVSSVNKDIETYQFMNIRLQTLSHQVNFTNLFISMPMRLIIRYMCHQYILPRGNISDSSEGVISFSLANIMKHSIIHLPDSLYGKKIIFKFFRTGNFK